MKIKEKIIACSDSKTNATNKTCCQNCTLFGDVTSVAAALLVTFVSERDNYKCN
jgi:hypothetical protein